MLESCESRKRRVFRWSGAARETARAYLHAKKYPQEARPGLPDDLKALVARLVEISGNPSDACRRFASQLGVREKQSYRPWTDKEQQKLTWQQFRRDRQYDVGLVIQPGIWKATES